MLNVESNVLMKKPSHSPKKVETIKIQVNNTEENKDAGPTKISRQFRKSILGHLPTISKSSSNKENLKSK